MSLAELLVVPLGWALRNKHSDPSRSVQFAQQLKGDGVLTITSPSFADGGVIPRKHSGVGRGDNRSPALHWTGMPEGTRQLLLIIEDTSAPMTQPIVHTIALLEPVEGIREGALTPGNLAVHYVPAFRGWLAYQGPRPFPGHGIHHYGFHLYALDTQLDAHGIAGLDQLLPLVAGHVLAAGVLNGDQKA